MALLMSGIHNLVSVPTLLEDEWESAEPVNEMWNSSTLTGGCLSLNLFLSELRFGSETGITGKVRFFFSC